ncbi:MAG: DUF1592 domain-containing protein [Acidobacteria bacterium]|nr:DUF1592 domain-containing protein [Acidobacteriota bacterium]
MLFTTQGFRIAALVAAALPLSAAPAFEEAVQPFLQQNCVACHNNDTKMADVDLAFAGEAAALEHPYIWQDVKRMIARGTMPPTGMPRPDAAAVEQVISWIDVKLREAAANAKPDPGRVTARRLNRTEYNNTVRDLFGIDFQPADEFPVDDSGYGFDNIGDVLTVSPVLMEKYLAAAGRIARAAIATDRKIPKPVSERYQQSRAEDGRAETVAVGRIVGFDPAGGIEVSHKFPATGDYEIRVRTVDRRPLLEKDGVSVPPPPVHMALFVDGRQLDEMIVQRGAEEPYPPIDGRWRVPAGKHELAAMFVDAETGPFDPNRDFEKRLLYSDYIEIEGPYDAEPPPPPSFQQQYVTCSPSAWDDQERCAKNILSHVARRAWRRPVAAEEVDKLVSFVKLAHDEGGSFEEGLQVALQATLVSPYFLFRIERDANPTDAENIHRLGPYELASRLSYFLWSSAPDEELLTAAGRGDLQDDAKLRAQVQRLLRDPRSSALIENFAGQWLELRNLSRANPDPDLFPEFDDELRKAMRRETELFFDSLLREDRSVLDFLDAKYTFLNERLAKHYGIEGVRGKEFRKVAVDGNQRGGILSQASVLTVASYPTRTSPVLRGVWVLDNILNAPAPPPPPGVPELKEDEVGVNGTLRQQFEKHRADPSCAVCHNRIDSLGFGLENYDPIGRWRTLDGKWPVDSAGELPGGHKFTSPGELKSILRETEGDMFVRGLIEKMLTYALGRGVERYDTPAIEQIREGMAANGYRFSSLIDGIVTSVPFRMRRGEEVSSDD